MPLSFCIDSVTFSEGAPLTLTPGSTTLIVGPNNSGKTSTLREIKYATAGHQTGPVVKSVTLNKHGDLNAIREWLDQNVALVISRRGISERVYSWLGSECPEKGLFSYDSQWDEPHVGKLSDFLCLFSYVEERIEYPYSPGDRVDVYNALTDAPQNLTHVLLRDELLADRVSALFRKAFNEDLIVNRGAGNVFPIHCGQKPSLVDGEDRVSHSFVTRLSALPLLSNQGHGMRSFAGCVLAAFASPALVHLIDEPEAFLHPPQARLIGNLLASEKPDWRQLIIATHSGDFLRGALDSGVDNLNVVRLTRDGDTNQARQLAVDDIRNLWADPILRFSNVLDGLFHESVVVCESDSDCRFYAALLEAIHDPDEARPDVLFSSTGGKDRMHVVISCLCSLGVPTRVVADFDVLNNEQSLRRIIEALGGAWGDIEGDWRATKTSVEQKAPPLRRNQVLAQIENILGEDDSDEVSKSDVEQVRKTLRATSSWDLAKQSGTNIVPGGEAHRRLAALLGSLRSIGLFVVECGELERFVPSVGGHGTGFVAEVLKRDLARDPELENARQFVADMFSVDIKQPPLDPLTSPGENGSDVTDTAPKKQSPPANKRYHLKKIVHHFASLLGIKE